MVLAVFEVFGQLGLHRPLQHRLGQLLQQTVLAGEVLRLLVVCQQLVNECARSMAIVSPLDQPCDDCLRS